MPQPYASIIIPVYNQLAYTKGCLDSIFRDRERTPFEIIVVDNASSDGTRAYLEQTIEDIKFEHDELIPIYNQTNLGVAPAWNQGLRAAKGRMIAILNNDIVLTKGWFRSLVWAMDLHKLALISPFAQGGELNYDLETRAHDFTAKNLSKLWDGYDFSAVVMPRQTFEKVGFFDENFKVGGYEDTDYCYRIRKAGMRHGISGACMIHHYGSRTLGEFKLRGDKHAKENLNYFISKWHEDPSAGVGSLTNKLRRSWRKFKLQWDCM